VPLSRNHCRLIIGAFALLLVVSQLMGLHYHRHAVVSAEASSGTTVHLRDYGIHAEHAADGADHHDFSDRASHPADDVEVEPIADSLAKYYKTWLSTGLLFLPHVWFYGVRPAPPVRIARAAVGEHPRPYVLSPPSNAPPLKSSFAQ